MSDDSLYVDYGPPRRLRADGKHSLEVVDNGTIRTIKCIVCDWQAVGLIADREQMERIGWAHISRPDLAVAGSSDVLRNGRLGRLRLHGGQVP
jgi:hypothetical protein